MRSKPPQRSPDDRLRGSIPEDGGLAFYVTSHGFGHMNRSVAVVNRIPTDVRVSIRSHANLFEIWPQRATRPIELGAFVSDAGAVNPPGDSAATDGPATLELAARVHAEVMEHLDREVDWLRTRKIAAVVCDAPWAPLVAARRAGIPGFLMSNFTWADIYAPHARAIGPDATRLVAELRSAYRQATALFRMQPGLKMSWLKPSIDVGIVANRGRDRRAELAPYLGLSPRERLVYLYIGRYGQDDLDWSRLERLAARGIHFVGFDFNPIRGPANLHNIPPAGWPGGDLVASCHAVVAKAGYGTACEAMASGTPMIYPPRWGFAEFRSLDRTLRDWGGGLPISESDFMGLRLEKALDRAFQIKPGPPPFPVDGSARIARYLAKLCREPATTPCPPEILP